MLDFFRRKKKTAILYLSHRVDDNAISGWRHIKDSCAGSAFAPFFVYDNSRADFPGHPEIQASETYLFSFDDLRRRWPMQIWTPALTIDQGNIVFVSLAFFKAHPQFDHYWRIEFDVVLDGVWADFFSAFSRNRSHLLTTTLARPRVRPDWIWWTTLERGAGRKDIDGAVRAFLPIARLSNHACAVLDLAYSAGWKGHDEVSVPTIMIDHGLSVEDIGGSGEFAQGPLRNRWYTNTPTKEGLGPGTFVCPPKEPSIDPREGKLYHPVKDRRSFAVELKTRRAVTREKDEPQVATVEARLGG